MSVHEQRPLRDVDTIDDARAVAGEAPGSRFAAALAAIAVTHPLRLYADGLLRAREPGMQRSGCGSRTAPSSRWRSSVTSDRADETDEQILRDVHGPVLDVGCGPGRHLHALARRGVFALGVDLSPVAVELARGGGGRAIVGSIFDELPGAGTWQQRAAARRQHRDRRCAGPAARARSRAAGRRGMRCSSSSIRRAPRRPRRARGWRRPIARSDWFPWARVGAADIDSLAAAAASSPAHRGRTADAGSRACTSVTPPTGRA